MPEINFEGGVHEYFETTGNRQIELGYDIFCVGSGEHSPIFIFFSPHGRYQIPAPFYGVRKRTPFFSHRFFFSALSTDFSPVETFFPPPLNRFSFFPSNSLSFRAVDFQFPCFSVCCNMQHTVGGTCACMKHTITYSYSSR